MIRVPPIRWPLRFWFTRYPVSDPTGWAFRVAGFGLCLSLEYFGKEWRSKSGDTSKRWELRFYDAPWWL